MAERNEQLIEEEIFDKQKKNMVDNLQQTYIMNKNGLTGDYYGGLTSTGRDFNKTTYNQNKGHKRYNSVTFKTVEEEEQATRKRQYEAYK